MSLVALADAVMGTGLSLHEQWRGLLMFSDRVGHQVLLRVFFLYLSRVWED